ncbi:MAG: ATP-binding cassette domain-containing protein [Clostridiales bacterium]|jgi:lincosamide and streptogramin A transport system ATP-binding/permease protein|nr:ATP-binding cassette domain-containing protein [Clostridiales bacterium]
MSLISVQNLTFAYGGGEPVFDNVSFQIDTDWRLGFVGRNGRGKTTFLRILAGELEYSGKISASVSFDYFSYNADSFARCFKSPEKSYTAQSPVLGATRRVLAGIAPEAEKWEIESEISRIGLDEEVMSRDFATLSGGERVKAMLAAMFCRRGGFPLIDEPTNHLDMNGRAAAASYLRGKKGFILVSHDREFLDGCVTHILAVNKAGVEVSRGNFSTWREDKERRDNFEEGRNRRLEKDIKRLDEAKKRAAGYSGAAEASKIGQGPCDRGFVGHKAAKLMNRAKNAERRREREIDEKEGLLKNIEYSPDLKITQEEYPARVLVSLRGVAVNYGGADVCSGVSFEIERGDRISLQGGNGSGKSSVIRLVCGYAAASAGEARLGGGLKISYVGQETSDLNGDLDEYARGFGIDISLFKTILRKLDFARAQFDKRLEDLSEGQKKKVGLARSLCERAHLHVWDEPLNYVDVLSRIQIERMIIEYKPTMIFAEHDKMFCEKAGNKVVKL